MTINVSSTVILSPSSSAGNDSRTRAQSIVGRSKNHAFLLATHEEMAGNGPNACAGDRCLPGAYETPGRYTLSTGSPNCSRIWPISPLPRISARARE